MALSLFMIFLEFLIHFICRLFEYLIVQRRREKINRCTGQTHSQNAKKIRSVPTVKISAHQYRYRNQHIVNGQPYHPLPVAHVLMGQDQLRNAACQHTNGQDLRQYCIRDPGVPELPLPRQAVDSIPKDTGDQRTSHSRCRHGKKTLESVLHRRTSQSKLFFQSRNILP